VYFQTWTNNLWGFGSCYCCFNFSFNVYSRFITLELFDIFILFF